MGMRTCSAIERAVLTRKSITVVMFFILIRSFVRSPILPADVRCPFIVAPVRVRQVFHVSLHRRFETWEHLREQLTRPEPLADWTADRACLHASSVFQGFAVGNASSTSADYITVLCRRICKK